MDTGAWSRIGPVAGLLSVASLAVAGATGGIGPFGRSPAGVRPDDPAAEIARALTLADARTERTVAAVMLLLAVFSFVWFLADLRQRLTEGSRPEGRWLAGVCFGGGLLGAGGFLIMALAQIGTVAIADYGEDVQAAKALMAIGWESTFLPVPGLAAMTLAAGALALRYGILPAWLGWMAVVAGVTAPLVWPLVGVWVVAVSIVLLARPSITGPSGDAPTPEPTGG